MLHTPEWLPHECAPDSIRLDAPFRQRGVGQGPTDPKGGWVGFRTLLLNDYRARRRALCSGARQLAARCALRGSFFRSGDGCPQRVEHAGLDRLGG